MPRPSAACRGVGLNGRVEKSFFIRPNESPFMNAHRGTRVNDGDCEFSLEPSTEVYEIT